METDARDGESVSNRPAGLIGAPRRASRCVSRSHRDATARDGEIASRVSNEGEGGRRGEEEVIRSDDRIWEAVVGTLEKRTCYSRSRKNCVKCRGDANPEERHVNVSVK